MKIILAGGTGQVGCALETEYRRRGHDVTVLTRTPSRPQDLRWDGEQLGPWVEALEGSDVLINLAGRSVNCRYTAENRRALYVPRGFAHGFLTLEDETEVSYEMGTRYVPQAARGFRWNDPRIAIDWPGEPLVRAFVWQAFEGAPISTKSAPSSASAIALGA